MIRTAVVCIAAAAWLRLTSPAQWRELAETSRMLNLQLERDRQRHQARTVGTSRRAGVRAA